MDIPHDKKVFPDESRLRGEHIAGYAKTLAKDQETYAKRFSKYVATHLQLEDLSKHFEETKNKILQGSVEAVKTS